MVLCQYMCAHCPQPHSLFVVLRLLCTVQYEVGLSKEICKPRACSYLRMSNRNGSEERGDRGVLHIVAYSIVEKVRAGGVRRATKRQIFTVSAFVALLGNVDKNILQQLGNIYSARMRRFGRNKSFSWSSKWPTGQYAERRRKRSSCDRHRAS